MAARGSNFATMAALVCLALPLAAVAADPSPSYTWSDWCPDTWPPLPADKPQSVVQIAVRVTFTPSTAANCSNPNFAKSMPASLATVSNRLMARARSKSAGPGGPPDFNKVKMVATTIVSCQMPATDGEPGVVNLFLAAPVQKGAADKTSPGSTDYGETLSWMSSTYHLADFCPADQGAHPYVYSGHSYAKDMNAWCQKAGAGVRLLAAQGCVQFAPTYWYRPYDVGRAACFPGDATQVRADPTTGRPLGRVRMDELAIGDAVRCLAPAAMADGGAGVALGQYRDDEQTYVPSTCRVYSYIHVDQARAETFVALHYTDDQGRPAKLRATGEHLVNLAPADLAAGASGASKAPRPLAELPPGGVARRADVVRVGDLLAVTASAQGPEEGGAPKLYVARVTKITREPGTGIYAPLLTRAGLPLVDGAAAFTGVQLLPGELHPMQNLGEHFRHVRMWADLEAALASGCKGAECPCLDAPEDPARPCVRLGMRLADIPAGISDYALRSHTVVSKALAEGRTYPDYARGIPLGRAYAARTWLPALARGLGFKPHTLGLLATDAFLTRPPAKGVAVAS